MLRKDITKDIAVYCFEHGTTSDGWEYWKYSDGRYEAEKIATVSTGSFTSQLSPNQSYPAVPADMVTVVAQDVSLIATTDSFACGLFRNSNSRFVFVRLTGNGGTTATLHYTCIGTWK